MSPQASNEALTRREKGQKKPQWKEILRTFFARYPQNKRMFKRLKAYILSQIKAKKTEYKAE